MAEPFVSQPGRGERVTLLGGQVSLIRPYGEHTGGLFSLLETRTPKGSGPPAHVHEREDEAFYILEGEVEVTIGEETTTATPGTFVFAPRGGPHKYVATQGPARHLTLVTPAGFELFFADGGGGDRRPDGGRRGGEALCGNDARAFGRWRVMPPVPHPLAGVSDNSTTHVTTHCLTRAKAVRTRSAGSPRPAGGAT